MSERGGWQAEPEEPTALPDPPAGETCAVPPDLDALPRLIGFVMAQGQRAQLAEADLARLAIVIEELFVNTVTHGGCADTAPTVILTVWVTQPGEVAVDYRDGGVAFNPLVDGPPLPPPDAVPESLGQRLGGVGLWLLRHYARQPVYQRRGERNRLNFRLGAAAA